ncbi:MAG: class I SAM-dependent methyltransferase [bacterium]|nr:class I SAM-dependent methyltransferase [bacterium]
MNSTENSFSCRLCDNRQYSPVLEDIPTHLNETYSLVQCGSCSFVTIYPLPTPEDLSRYYDENYWQPEQEKKKTRGLTPEERLYEFRMRGILRFIEKTFPQKEGVRALDWGAGDGAWVRYLLKNGYETVGLDRYSIKPQDECFINGDIKDAGIPGEAFQIITCFHVLEHLHDPVESFKAAFEKLKKGGLMIIEVPHIGAWGFKLFGKRWQPLQVPTHLNHFTLDTIKQVIRSGGEDRAKIITTGFFSMRASPAALVLSLFPALTPKSVRREGKGGYGMLMKMVYLGLQLSAYPFSRLAGTIKKGSIMRLALIKN